MSVDEKGVPSSMQETILMVELDAVRIAKENRRRADRYPEAIRLIEAWSQGLSGDSEFISSKQLNEWTKAFLAEEPKP